MTTFQPASILLIGATGTIGKYITEQVVNAQPPFSQVTILTSEATVAKKAKHFEDLRSKGVKVITGDVTNEQDVKKAYEGVDTVISAVGRGVLESQIELIRIAEESPSVKWFFPSEYGTDIDYDASSVNEKPHQLKLKVRKYIRDNIKRLKYTYVVTGPYPEMYFDVNPNATDAGGFDVANKKAYLIDNGESKIGFTAMPDVGKAVVAALRHPEASFNKALKVQSFIVTSKQILAEFEKQTGGQPWATTSHSLDEIKAAEEKAWAEGKSYAVSYTLRRIWTEGKTLYENTDNEKIELAGSNLDSLETVVRRSLTTGY